ncbi:glycogen synthase GlgA [Herbaspirillum sp. WKF16]|uniref:glycogen synthase GlgA n=1 Tax=Herbaspirillum sp. WKF16 TaxID=3028312 RepID=UPI0023A9E062|nr:glycogen synthase GlgA [Herbaspirillum sp. WKF16]WDZ94246.1 glycogen synthase GlgA [Herbaspirillum sp. WKF16]
MQARVLLVSSEAVPLVKTGGLADVITALAVSLRKAGIDASILMPAYPEAVRNLGETSQVGLKNGLPGGAGRLLRGVIPGTDVPALLLDTARFRQRGANPYLDHDGVEFNDNALCFADLSHAAVAICAGETSLPAPHVVHANDWHAGLIPCLLKLRGLDHIGTMLTIHNLAFQGNFDLRWAEQVGIPQHLLTGDGVEYWGKLSFLKAGIRFSDCVSTVSRNYAHEIMTQRFGCGMDGVLSFRKLDLRAIPNAIDAELWNPADDTLIARNFSVGHMKGKAVCKRDLQKLFGLTPADPFAPVLGIGSRISHQKMADVVLASLPGILARHERLQVVVLGCGEREYEEGFLALAERYPGRVGVHIGYDERRAHALHAGSDMLLHPTRFEPYGLTPIYAMRYGAIPIGSRVGGLVDTVRDAGLDPANATGVLFDGETVADMQDAVARAFELYADTRRWQAIQRNAMSVDCDWSGPTQAYIDAYAHVADMAVRPLFARPRSAPVTAVERPVSNADRMARPAAAIAAAIAGVVGGASSVAAA